MTSSEEARGPKNKNKNFLLFHGFHSALCSHEQHVLHICKKILIFWFYLKDLFNCARRTHLNQQLSMILKEQCHETFYSLFSPEKYHKIGRAGHSLLFPYSLFANPLIRYFNAAIRYHYSTTFLNFAIRYRYSLFATSFDFPFKLFISKLNVSAPFKS
jgi:hypothetical protein